LLSMVILGVWLMNTMKGEYFVLAWMPHQYPKNILDRSKSQSCMLVTTITMNPCLMVFIRHSTIPSHWGQTWVVNWCVMP
jgi:hypothetical protein